MTQRKPRVTFEVFSRGGIVRPRRYYWRARTRNGKIVAIGGEPFVSRANAVASVKNFNADIKGMDYRFSQLS